MEKAYRHITYYIAGVFAVIFIGFYKTYFGKFPRFENIRYFHHFHAAILLTWLMLLAVQPILIRKRLYDWHRALGKFSYFLFPVVIASILVAYKGGYYRMEAEGVPHADNLGFLFMPLTDALPFAIFYVLAIINANRIPSHMRYMIATSFIVAQSGVVRIFLHLLGLSDATTAYAATGTTFLLFVAFIMYDRSRGRKIATNPFTIAFMIFLVPNTLLFIIPKTQVWQNFAASMVKALF